MMTEQNHMFFANRITSPKKPRKLLENDAQTCLALHRLWWRRARIAILTATSKNKI